MPAASETVGFLKLNGVDGESSQKGFEKQLELTSVSWGVSNSSTFGSGSTGGSGSHTLGQVHDLAVTKSMDKSSVILQGKVVTGDHIKDGILTLVKRSKDELIKYLEVKLKDVLVTGYNFALGQPGTLPSESVTLSFVEFKAEYSVQDNTGKKTGTADFGINIQTGVKV